MDSGLKYSQEYIVLTGVQLRILIGISIKLVVVLSRVQILIGISIGSHPSEPLIWVAPPVSTIEISIWIRVPATCSPSAFSIG